MEASVTAPFALLYIAQIDDVKDTEASREIKRMLIGDVQDAIGDMLDLIRTYSSKRRITQVVVSTLFKRRMDETEAVINQTFADLMVSSSCAVSLLNYCMRPSAPPNDYVRGAPWLLRILGN